MTPETILTNATLVLPDDVLPGTLVLRDGRIAEVQPGRSHALPGAIDLRRRPPDPRRGRRPHRQPGTPGAAAR